MDKITLKAQKREIVGKKVKSLRKNGLLPANIYGKKVKSLAVQLDLNEFQKVYKKAGETNLINLLVDSEKNEKPVLISNLQIHPVTESPLHVDFHQVDLTQKVSVGVPVEIVGISPAVKEKGAVLLTLLNEIKVESLPQNLPDKFTVDISSLVNYNDSFAVKDLAVDRSKLEIQAEEDEAIVVVQEPKQEEEIIETTPEAKKIEDVEAAQKEDENQDTESESEEKAD